MLPLLCRQLRRLPGLQCSTVLMAVLIRPRLRFQHQLDVILYLRNMFLRLLVELMLQVQPVQEYVV